MKKDLETPERSSNKNRKIGKGKGKGKGKEIVKRNCRTGRGGDTTEVHRKLRLREFGDLKKYQV